MVTMDTLSYKEKLIRFYESHTRMPTYSEMANLFGFKSKNAVARLVAKLVTAGVVAKDRLGRLIPGDGFFGRIKMLGLVEAGFATPAEENLLDTISLDDFLVQRHDASFMLRVKGDSMYDAGIREGDLVIVERSQTARAGDIVIAEVDGGWTMKYLRKNGSITYLEPANSAFENIYPKESLTITAVVKAVIRKY